MQYKFNKAQFIQKLEEKGAINPCHRCGHKNFTIIEGATNIQLQETLELDGSFVLGGGASMPVVYVACANCGAITMHALGALGMIDLGAK